MANERWGRIAADDAQESIAVDDSVKTLTLPAHFSSNGVNDGRAVCLVRDAAVLFTTSGVTPTAADESTGDKASAGDRVVLVGLEEIRSAKFIRATGTDGAIFVRYEKRVN